LASGPKPCLRLTRWRAQRDHRLLEPDLSGPSSGVRPGRTSKTLPRSGAVGLPVRVWARRQARRSLAACWHEPRRSRCDRDSFRCHHRPYERDEASSAPSSGGAGHGITMLVGTWIWSRTGAGPEWAALNPSSRRSCRPSTRGATKATMRSPSTRSLLCSLISPRSGTSCSRRAVTDHSAPGRAGRLSCGLQMSETPPCA
jgi:hypothetical protein